MTKASKLIESLITILDRDVLSDICDKIGSDSMLCKGISCNDCPFHNLHAPDSTEPLKNILKTIKTVELIDVDSK